MTLCLLTEKLKRAAAVAQEQFLEWVKLVRDLWRQEGKERDERNSWNDLSYYEPFNRSEWWGLGLPEKKSHKPPATSCCSPYQEGGVCA